MFLPEKGEPWCKTPGEIRGHGFFLSARMAEHLSASHIRGLRTGPPGWRWQRPRPKFCGSLLRNRTPPKKKERKKERKTRNKAALLFLFGFPKPELSRSTAARPFSSFGESADVMPFIVNMGLSPNWNRPQGQGLPLVSFDL